MAFRTVEQFNDDKYKNKFVLQNDKDSADVVFLYRSYKEMLVADAHYIRTSTYSGYVHCCGNGCPVCALKKPDGSPLIRLQSKIFIPLFNINKTNPDDPTKSGVIEFWDRTPKFEQAFKQDVFDTYSNPSEYVFKIIRHGLAGDINTRYEIRPIGKNSFPGMSYDDILARFHATMPDYYENIIKSFSISELTEMLQTQNNDAGTVTQDYVPVPRAGYQSSIPDTFVNASDIVGGDAAEAAYVPDFADTEADDVEESESGESDFPTPKF